MDNRVKDTQKQFIKDIKKHQMTIHRDNGVDRHIRFQAPGTSCYFFDLITWPGHLCITGDCGTYVFRRTHDMFNFFSQGNSRKYPINPHYWSGKLLSVSVHGGVTEFSREKFNEAVWSDFIEFAKYGEHTPEQIRRMHKEIKERILDPDGEHDAWNRINDYEDDDFRFEDFFDHNCHEDTYHFIWNLFAIVWGIAKYDKSFVDAMRDMNRC